MAVSVSYNKKRIFLFAAALCAIAIAAVSTVVLYFSPAEYIDIIYEQAEDRRIIVELSINRFRRKIRRYEFPILGAKNSYFACRVTAFVPEEYPDQPEGRDDLIVIFPLSLAVPGLFLFRLELHRLAVSVN
jgi:hypothetical protein